MSCVPNRPTGRELFSLSFGLNTEWRCTHMSPLVVYVVVDVVVDILTTSICAFVFCDARRECEFQNPHGAKCKGPTPFEMVLSFLVFVSNTCKCGSTACYFMHDAQLKSISPCLACLTKYLSFGERPVNCPVETQKVPLLVTSPSLCFTSCSNTCGYGRLRCTVVCDPPPAVAAVEKRNNSNNGQQAKVSNTEYRRESVKYGRG